MYTWQCSHHVDKGTNEDTRGGTHTCGCIPSHIWRHTRGCTRVCVHAQRHTHTGDPSHPVPGFLPGGTSFPSQLQQQGPQCSPHHPLWSGPRPSPCTFPASPASLALMHSLQSGPLCGFPWPSPRLLSSCEDCHDLWPLAPHFLHTLLEAAQWPHWPLYGCLRTCVWNPVTSSLVMPMLPSGLRLGAAPPPLQLPCQQQLRSPTFLHLGDYLILSVPPPTISSGSLELGDPGSPFCSSPTVCAAETEPGWDRGREEGGGERSISGWWRPWERPQDTGRQGAPLLSFCTLVDCRQDGCLCCRQS